MLFVASLNTFFVLIALAVKVDGLQIGPLLSSCVDACQRGCLEIRNVHQETSASSDGLKVEYKDSESEYPRSALTEADLASQRIIVGSLRSEWGDKLRIVAEEDEDGDGDASDDNDSSASFEPLRKDLFDDDLDETPEINIEDVTIFVDPLDATREFVEGRLDSCQVLVGIAIEGEAVAGSIGIPFPSGADTNEDEGPTVVYGLAGLGSGVIGTPLARGPIPLERNIDGIKYPRPHHAMGDSTDDVMVACKDAAIKKFGGSKVLYGGAGNKILAAALGEVTCSIQHKVGGPWDLCAPEAIVKAMGGTITDLFGEEIEIYKNSAPPRCNERGYVASAPGLEQPDQYTFHEKLIAAINAQPAVQEYRESLK